MPVMTRREFTKTLTTGALGAVVAGPALASLAEEASAAAKRPNFVFICSDQHSSKVTGFAGHPLVKTPNMDRIASQGTIFSNAYCGSPLCVPGRSSMMTGMYASDVNSFCNSTVYDGSHPTWGKRLRDSGYHCWAVGKQDMNPAVDMGFVEAGVDHGHVKSPDICSLFRRPVCYRLGEREGVDGAWYDRTKPPSDDEKKTNPFRDARDTAAAVNFIREEAKQQKQPWVAFVGLREPHPEWIGPKEYFDEYLPNVTLPQVSLADLENLPLPYQVMRHFKRIATPIPEEKIRRAIAAYCAMVSELDENVGKIYEAVKASGQLDSTVFIYTSDHGESLGENGMWLKNNLYEGASHIPLFMTGPGIPKGNTIDTPVGHVDLVATMLAMGGAALPDTLRGASLVPLLEGRAGGGPKFAYCESHSEGNPTGSFMIRKGEWKYIHFPYYSDCLFDLTNDPGEKKNLIDDPSCASVAAELKAILMKQVDPVEVTERAFKAQDAKLREIVAKYKDKDAYALAGEFRRRLGEGEAMVIANRLKRGEL